MSDVKPIFHLPKLEAHQEWACEQGCEVRSPKKFRSVYSQQWDKSGKLVKELAEHYYTCQRNHLLMVWDNNTNDYAELAENHYKDSEVE